ncbi:MAG: MarR family transcriptional regulator [Hyphomicrobium zavarzinii]|uniref:MarR family winged helix-turn-helix transcriptional regulator n=1 Tax=Hyphomicrobium zavarzinii TaxID=48292 RepID=UPI001A5DF089|nr:MarR family transcriptional regulator [Hyphomicrobium zavarzinii]MBL8846869.1 MarR family transcriptional regulator [Hyphomicrobium zavarzinii]
MAFKYVNMADITRDPSGARRQNLTRDSAQDAPSSANGRADLITHVELFFFAYRDFTGDPDAVLAQYGFGRAHHRVLHFVHRNPGLRVANLLEILKITKQSLARVLKQLIGEGFITQRAGAEDRRERLLYATVKGTRLAEKLTALQVKRVEAALAAAGPEAEAATKRFLLAMISEEDRAQVEALVRVSPAGDKTSGENR